MLFLGARILLGSTAKVNFPDRVGIGAEDNSGPTVPRAAGQEADKTMTTDHKVALVLAESLSLQRDSSASATKGCGKPVHHSANHVPLQ